MLDNDKMKQGKCFHGIPIIDPTALVNLIHGCENVKIVIASGSAHIIKLQLEKLGIAKDIIEIFALTNLQDNPTPYQVFMKYIRDIEAIYDQLEDEQSQQTFLGLLNYKMTMKEKYLTDYVDHEDMQYFDPMMKYSDNEYFVDCGAFIGDTLDRYAEISHRQWKQYYCFEADKDIFAQLKQHVKRCGYHNVTLFNFGCWSEKKMLHFRAVGSGSSAVTDDGTIEIQADTLDRILHRKNVSVIKMDIEGAERMALIGARSIIQHKHPRLAISIYHSLMDFFKIPELILRLDPSYRLYIRHYRAMTDSETICYAI